MLPLFWIAVAFTAGILVAHTLPISIWVWVGLNLAGVLFVIISSIYPRLRNPFQRIKAALRVSPAVLLLFFCLGGARFSLSVPRLTPQDLAWYNDRGSFTLTAVVDRSPDQRESATYLHMNVRELYDPVTLTYLRIHGEALVQVSANSDFQLGDLLRFTALPRTPSENEDFSYQNYLERQGIYTVIYHPTSIAKVGTNQVSWFWLTLEKARQLASQTIYKILPQPESGLLEGILLGNDNNLPQSVQKAYQDTGTAHIIAISGFNMTVLAALFLWIFARLFSRTKAVGLTLLVLLVYTLFVGASPSVVRAAIMAVVAFSGHLIGRKGGGLNALGLTAGLMLANNPLLLWDASFQLSFAATFGLIVFAVPFETKLKEFLSKRFSEKTTSQLTGPVSEYFLFSFAAQITTLPVVALQFKRLSLTSIFANVLVLPVQEAILIGGIGVTLLGMIWFDGGRLLAALLWPLIAYSNRTVEWIDQLRNSAVTITGSLAIWISLLACFLIIASIIYFYRMKWLKKINLTFIILGLAVGAALIWSVALRLPDGKVHISLVRAGDGTALYVQSPNGETLVIDPGGSPNTLASTLSQFISPWNFHLEAALLTTRSSVATLVKLNDRLPVKQAILAPSVYHLVDNASPLTLPEGMDVKELLEEETIALDNQVQITVLASDSNHAALLLSYGQVRVFIPGGLEPAAFKKYRSSDLRGLSVLILNDADAANLPADMWQNFGARTVLWNSTSLSPDPSWLGADSQQSIHFACVPNSCSVNIK